MKTNHFLFIVLIIVSCINVQGRAQEVIPVGATQIIEPYHVAITINKTTNLLFDYAIKSVDRGSSDVLAQKAKGVENILQLKAARQNFIQTNLTIVTADGKFYSCIVDYVDVPAILNIRFTGKPSNEIALLSTTQPNEACLEEDASKILEDNNSGKMTKDKSFGIKLQLEGIYVRDEVMYLHLSIHNQTNINYDIAQLRLYLKDQKKSKRTASQEIEIRPFYRDHDTAAVAGSSSSSFVLAVPKFTIPDKKNFYIQLMEKAGGRHLQLIIGNKILVKAKPIP